MKRMFALVMLVAVGLGVVSCGDDDDDDDSALMMVMMQNASSGSQGGKDESNREGVIKAGDDAVGFASIGEGYVKTGKGVVVSTKEALLKAIKTGGLIYIDGMIDMTEGMLPSIGGGSTPKLDAFVKAVSGGEYASYEAYKSAYASACTKATDDKALGNAGNSKMASLLWRLNHAWQNNKYKAGDLMIDGNVAADNSTAVLTSGEFKDWSGIELKIKSGTTIIGLTDFSGIKGGNVAIGRNVKGTDEPHEEVKNVVLRNLRIVDAYDPFTHHEKNDGYNAQFDCVTVGYDDCAAIWADHCTFGDTMTLSHVTDGDGTDEKWQTFDGCFDMKGTCAGVTVSYCLFTNHDKTMLIGSSDSEGDNTVRKISLIGNHFKGCAQRLPMVRNTQLHAVNNYFEGGTTYGNSYCIGARKGALVYSQCNVFSSDIAYSHSGSKSTAATAKVLQEGNLDSSSRGADESGYTPVKTLQELGYTLPYTFSAKSADKVADYVTKNSGAGVWKVER